MAEGLYIFSAPIRSGKTSSLIEWAADKEVYGILTPDIDGRRFFMNAHTKELFRMEADAEETDTLSVGRFIFSKINFDKANQVIRSAVHSKGWLIIDEVGPLELKGQGFHDVLQEVFAARKESILLIVREGLADTVKKYFGLKGVVVNSVESLE